MAAVHGYVVADLHQTGGTTGYALWTNADKDAAVADIAALRANPPAGVRIETISLMGDDPANPANRGSKIIVLAQSRNGHPQGHTDLDTLRTRIVALLASTGANVGKAYFGLTQHHCCWIDT